MFTHRVFEAKPTQKFLIIALATVVVVSFVSNIPLLFRLFAMNWAGDNFYQFASFYSVGAGKVRVLHLLVNFAMVTVTCIFLFLLRRPGGLSRFAILLGTLFCIWLTDKNFHVYSDYHLNRYTGEVFDTSKLWYAYEKLRLHQHDEPVDYRAMFSPEFIRNEKIASYTGFYEAVSRRFEGNREQLSKVWGIKSEEKLKALYFLNQTSWLWAYGNEFALDRAGCVSNNELTNFAIDEKWSSPDFYLNSPIGCCTDYAHMLKFLLDSAGIENKMVEIPGHIFNEARVDGKPLILDATVGYAIPYTWQQIASKGFLKKIDIELFPNKSMQDPGSKDYRPISLRFRLHMLNQIALGPSAEFSYSNRKPVFLR